jgi:hypothetical protein
LCSSPIRNSRRGLRRFVGMRWDVGGRSKSPTVIDGIRPGNRVRTGLPAGGSSLERTRLCLKIPC